MSEKIYNKLIRDNVPDYTFKNKDIKCITKILSVEEYEKELERKLIEEVNEYLESKDIVELADILEVISAIAITKDADFDVIRTIKANKKKRLGSFTKRLYLIKTEDKPVKKGAQEQ